MFMIPCPFYFYFGFECIGCGFQRSLMALSHFDFYTSLRFFPGMIPLLGYFILEILRLLKLNWTGLNNAIFIFGTGAFIIQLGNYILRLLNIIPWAHELSCSY